jgi:hypothetical protein
MSQSGQTAAKEMERARLPNWKLSYRLDEAEAATGLSRSTLYNRARAGRLTMKKEGNITIITRDELLRYLESIPAITFDDH